MRCSECGYMNDQGVKECTKCGTKLSASEPSPAPPPVQDSAPRTQADPSAGNPTVRGSASSQPSWDAPSGGGESDYRQCPDCGHYPLQQPVSGQHPCPNCQSTGTPGESSPKESTSGKTSRLENVNFGAAPEMKLTDIQTGKEHRFSGSEVELKRESLDPGNDAISSSHARLRFKNGTWTITDQSSNQATFIQVQGEKPLTDQTKVIIGNKVYRVDLSE